MITELYAISTGSASSSQPCLLYNSSAWNTIGAIHHQLSQEEYVKKYFVLFPEAQC